MDCIPVASLSQKKYAQLESAISIPPMYLSIEKYELVQDINAVVYEIEIGIQKSKNVYTHKVNRRYSALEEFDRQIRPQYSNSKYLLPFPPKKMFGNKDPSFLEQRSSQLQQYLASMIKIPGVCICQTFTHFFEIDTSVINDI